MTTGTELRPGTFVEMDGLLAVIVGVSGDEGVPDEHVALWFGDPRGDRVSQGGIGGLNPEVWTVPQDLISPAQAPIYKH
jgi:hypothetical protein